MSDYGTPPPPPAGPNPYSAPEGFGAPPQGAYGYPAQEPPALAKWGTRVGGYLLDGLVAAPGGILMLFGLPTTTVINGVQVVSGPGVMYFIGALVALGLTAWNRWFKGGTTGQTVGRGFVGVKVVAEATGQPIGPGKAFLRDLTHVLDSALCYVGWLFPIWDAKRQTFADKIMATVAINVPK